MPSSLRCHEINEPPPNISCMDLNSAHDAGIREQTVAGAEFDTDFINSDMDEDVVFNEVTGEHQVTETDGDANLCRNLQINKYHPSLAYTTDQKWTIELLKVLNDMNAPDYAFKSIMEWARDAHADGYSFKAVVGGVSRSKNVDSLIKNSVHNARLVLPSVLTVNCPHSPHLDVICFDFVPQLLSLLQNRIIMTQENLVIDVNDPLKPYTSPDNLLNEAISGRSEYRKAYD